MSQQDGSSRQRNAAFDRAYDAFLAAFPGYAGTTSLDEWRRTDYARLDAGGHVYLDYTGGGQYAARQVRQHQALLEANVFGNPHSHNPASLAMTTLVEQARARVLGFFNADPDDYTVVFTPNASGALKLVGEAYPFAPGGHFALAVDDHNSVNGIREYARAGGARVSYVPLVAPDLRLDRDRLDETLGLARAGEANLFAYPAQSNYSGVQHPMSLIDRAHDQGWDVLLDAAAFAPTNRLDLGRWRPDFVSLSFYKMFGYPTGVGALLARRPALRRLRRPWFAGGTIRIASVVAGRHLMGEDEAAFEDGTVNYLNIPAVEIGLRHLEEVGLDGIHERVRCLTGWILSQVQELHHENGRALARIRGPQTLEERGGTVSLSFFDPSGDPVPGELVERLAGEAGISLRTGCFCNPGAGETAFGLPASVMVSFFDHPDEMSFQRLAADLAAQHGVDISAVRVSVGLASNFADVHRFLQFAAGLRNQRAASLADRAWDEAGPPAPVSVHDAG